MFVEGFAKTTPTAILTKHLHLCWCGLLAFQHELLHQFYCLDVCLYTSINAFWSVVLATFRMVVVGVLCHSSRSFSFVLCSHRASSVSCWLYMLLALMYSRYAQASLSVRHRIERTTSTHSLSVRSFSFMPCASSHLRILLRLVSSSPFFRGARLYVSCLIVIAVRCFACLLVQV